MEDNRPNFPLHPSALLQIHLRVPCMIGRIVLSASLASFPLDRSSESHETPRQPRRQPQAQGYPRY